MQQLTELNIDPYINLEAEIAKLKKEMNAVILAHYYQDPEIQEIADFIGDSLELSRKAAETNADTIIFCGVKFMAEAASILNPKKQVLLPDLNAGCSLEDSCKPAEFKKFRQQHPNHVYVTYINCSAEVKALSDIIVTSSSAEAIINSIPLDKEILFAPDKHLGNYLIRKTGRPMTLWNGTCIVHENFSERELVRIKTMHPGAEIIAHPECPTALLEYANHIGSTSSLLNYVKENNGLDFIVLTEPGIIHQMHKVSPESKFYDVPSIEGGCTSCSQCPYMRLNSLEKIYLCMVNKAPEIKLDPQVAAKARLSLERMLTGKYTILEDA
ncbi:MAG: quinolinate synthase NadA [Rickettsiaceae bacterium]|nr:quinolinate synthase NadA [Rickettsiaceae bacterium]MDP4832971.1 quinolinate synthase NadA [Rickettsiaceae bacterium]MDP5020513.1 quinolinate synthase NadA [Rickettsiaceae bacterium]MDP5083643.1 quinolinate synthase NadA [Rickettsiaceae bacterium]